MRALLDTHTFLWWNIADPRLSSRVKELIADEQNDLFFSAASAWEIAIKARRGSLIIPEIPERYIANRLSLHQIIALPVQISHAVHVFHLPDYHRDPFDRLLIAQSQLENMPILTSDSNIRKYEVEVIW